MKAHIYAYGPHGFSTAISCVEPPSTRDMLAAGNVSQAEIDRADAALRGIPKKN